MPKKRGASKQRERRGVNLVERRVLEMGWIWRPLDIEDYGVDGQIEITTPIGGYTLPTAQILHVQVKAGKSYFSTSDAANIYLSRYHISEDDLSYWRGSSVPVVLVVCEPDKDEAYYMKIAPSQAQQLPIAVPKAQVFDDTACDDLRRFVFTYRRTRAEVALAILDTFRRLGVLTSSPKEDILCDIDLAAALRRDLEFVVECYFSIPLTIEDYIHPRVLDRVYLDPKSCDRLHPRAREYQRETILSFIARGLRPLISIGAVNLLHGLASFEMYKEQVSRTLARVANQLATYEPFLRSGLAAIAPLPVIVLALRDSEGPAFQGERQIGSIHFSSRVNQSVEVFIDSDDILASVQRVFPTADNIWEMESFHPRGSYIRDKTGEGGPYIDYWLGDAADLFFEFACVGGMPVIPSTSVLGLDASIPDLVLRTWARVCSRVALRIEEALVCDVPDFRDVDSARLADFMLAHRELSSSIGESNIRVARSVSDSRLTKEERVAMATDYLTEADAGMDELGRKLRETRVLRARSYVRAHMLVNAAELAPPGFNPSVIQCAASHSQSGALAAILRSYTEEAAHISLNPAYGVNAHQD